MVVLISKCGSTEVRSYPNHEKQWTGGRWPVYTLPVPAFRPARGGPLVFVSGYSVSGWQESPGIWMDPIRTDASARRKRRTMDCTLPQPTGSSDGDPGSMLQLFVYGTLKRGFWNHARYCRDVLAVTDAVVRGRLLETSSGIPVLMVPEEDIRGIGSLDPRTDVSTQAHWTARKPSPATTPPSTATDTPWGPVYGELLTFDDPVARLPAIDRLEGFYPGGSSLYRRALVPIRSHRAVCPVWLYVGTDSTLSRGTLTGRSSWQSEI